MPSRPVPGSVMDGDAVCRAVCDRVVLSCCVSVVEQDEDDYDVMQDPEFLQSVLENLPGVDPNNEAIRNAMGSLASQTGNKPDDKKEEEKKK